MGQRTQSLTLAGIMFLSVLAGMLMFDLDSTTEEPPNIKPSIAGDSGKTLQAGLEPVSYTHLTLPTICSV